eukprot:6731349-Alexandrium_andersonii.AAC.1
MLNVRPTGFWRTCPSANQKTTTASCPMTKYVVECRLAGCRFHACDTAHSRLWPSSMFVLVGGFGA